MGGYNDSELHQFVNVKHCPAKLGAQSGSSLMRSRLRPSAIMSAKMAVTSNSQTSGALQLAWILV